MMRLFTMLMLLLLVTSAWAGTWRDNFEDGDLVGWKTMLGDGANWSVIDGELDAIGPGSLQGIVPDMASQEYTCETRLRILGGGAIGCGMSVYLQPDLTGDYVMNVQPGNTVSTGIWLGGLNNVIQVQGFNTAVVLDRWHIAKIVCQPGKIEFFLDDQLARTLVDERFESGYVKFWTADDHVRFDDIKLTGEGIPDTGPSGPNSPFALQSNGKLATTWAEMR